MVFVFNSKKTFSEKVLPKKALRDKTFFVTTAIDYPNSSPHLGHAYEKVVSDVQARWHRLKGEKVFFLTGTDEHGLKIQRAAEKAGLQPQTFVDQQVEKFRELCKKWNISYDHFIRTTDSSHVKVSQEVFKKVLEKDDIYLGTYEGLYCVSCENYYTEKDLVNGLCPVHQRPVEIVKEETYFFKLSKYQQQLLDFFKKNPEFISPESRRLEIVNRVKEGLRDLSVSRTSFKWGIPLPNNPKHVQYVWFDALLNYYSATRAKKELNEFWPTDVHNIGKDIAWFHTVIWPCMLFSAGIEQPKRVFIHGFINTESGERLSKTAGNTIDPIELADQYGVDQLRYFLLREIPFGQDGYFSLATLQARVNNELANGLGNLLNRSVTLAEKKLNNKITKQKTDSELEKQLSLQKIAELMDNFQFHLALTEIFSFVAACNKYVNDQKPWEQEPAAAAVTLYNVVDALRVLAILLEPFIPSACEKINHQLGLKKAKLDEAKLGLLKETTVRKGEILFSKIESK
jgi:methionyl-tRNA synthetase